MSFHTDLADARNRVIIAQAALTEAENQLAALLAQAVKDGPDVSQFQGNIDWNAMATAGAGFTFTRTSDGDIRDTSYSGTRVAAVRQAGIPLGVYHFGRVASPGNNERDGRVEAGMACHFATQHGWGKKGDLPLAYDFETLNGQDAPKAAKHLLQFVKTYDWIMQHPPIVYTNPATINAIAPHIGAQDLDALARCHLWIAHWGVPAPTVPSPWIDWTFWQHTSTGSIPGVTGNVDLNHFSGSKSDLDALKIK